MAEIGGESGEPGLDVASVAVGIEEGADREGVAKIVQPWLAAGRARPDACA